MEKVRTRERALEKLVEFIAEFANIEEITILQDRYTDETTDLLERLGLLFTDREICYPDPALWAVTGSASGAHCHGRSDL